MSGLFKMFGMSAVSMAVCAMFSVADAAQPTGRGANGSVRAASVRMPTMPTLPIISVGNISTNVPSGGAVVPDKPDNVKILCPFSVGAN